MAKAFVRRLTLLGCVLSAGAGSAVARAQESGVEVGFRTGYALPMGQVTDEGDDPDMDNFISGAVPLWFDLGYRATPNVLVGAYFQYGFGIPGGLVEDLCDRNGVDCSLPVVRVGAQLHYHAQPFQAVDPWIGAGIGYEWMTWSAEAEGQEGSLGVSGIEFVNFQGGLDLGIGDERKFAVGPFVALSIGQYSSFNCDGILEDTCADDIEEKALHQWLTIGLRGVVVP
jgi:hypothetical protein